MAVPELSGQEKAVQIALVAVTELVAPEAFSPLWSPEVGVSGSESLVEAAGRACFQSWPRPNPATARNVDYIKHIIEVGHLSILRHATATFYIEGISRACSHEVIRHHVGIDYSQLSQRYVDSGSMDYVIPPAFRGNRLLEDQLHRAWKSAVRDYEIAVDDLLAAGRTRKQAREAARAFLPNCAETKIVITANLQAWRNFIEMRGSIHADAEIRELAVKVATVLISHAPAVFQDVNIDIVDGFECVSVGQSEDS